MAKNGWNWTLAAIWLLGLRISTQLTLSWFNRDDDVWFSAKSTFQAKMQLSSGTLNFAKGFLHKDISRNFCHNIHVKSQEGSLTAKRADSKRSSNICKNFATHKSKQLQCSMEAYILKQLKSQNIWFDCTSVASHPTTFGLTTDERWYQWSSHWIGEILKNQIPKCSVF